MMFSRFMPRRLLLTTTLVAALSAALSACGGGDDAPSEPSRAQQAADKGVQQGLVGVAITRVTPNETDEGVAGVRKAGDTDPIRRGDWFLLGSNTKAMTASVAARLVERGVIAWTTTLAEALPDLAANMGTAYRTVTLEQLLNHRGGILAFNNAADVESFASYLQTLGNAQPSTLVARKQLFAAWLLAQPSPPGITPGRDFFYSNAGYALAAMMLEARTGLSFQQLFDQEMARPLGIEVRWVKADEAVVDGPNGHAGAEGKPPVVLPPFSAEEALWSEVIRPAGPDLAIRSTSYGRWIRWHLLALQGQPTPLAPGYVQRLKALATDDYAMGWAAAVTPDGRRVLMHSGEWGGFDSAAMVDQAGRSGSLALTNIVNSSNGDSWVFMLLYPMLEALQAGSPIRENPSGASEPPSAGNAPSRFR